MATLHFEIGPDAFQTGAPGDTTRANVYFGTDPGGVATLLGTFTSGPEVGNDGVREWSAFAVTVAHNPANDYRVEVEFVAGAGTDTCHVRGVYLTRDDSSVRNAEYPKGKAYDATQLAALGLPVQEIGESDGGFAIGATVYDACALAVVTSPRSPRSVWYFSAVPVDPCPPTVGGWALAGVSLP